MLKRRLALKTLAGVGGATSFGLTANRSFAESFPAKPVRIVTPFPPGAGPDAALRVISDPLSKKWAQPVVIDNRPGGAATIGMDLVAKAPPDGYTVGVANVSLGVNPHILEERLRAFYPAASGDAREAEAPQ